MTTLTELEELLCVERIHAGHFEAWAERATDPLAKMVFRLAADKERNHVGWVELMMEIAKAKQPGRDLGVTREDLAFWVRDEGSEGASYERLLTRVEEPWIRAALGQMAHDEATNASLLEGLLARPD
jgi:rubrerythrin